MEFKKTSPSWGTLGSLKQFIQFGPSVWPATANIYMSEELYFIDIYNIHINTHYVYIYKYITIIFFMKLSIP